MKYWLNVCGSPWSPLLKETPPNDKISSDQIFAITKLGWVKGGCKKFLKYTRLYKKLLVCHCLPVRKFHSGQIVLYHPLLLITDYREMNPLCVLCLMSSSGGISPPCDSLSLCFFTGSKQKCFQSYDTLLTKIRNADVDWRMYNALCICIFWWEGRGFLTLCV